jgi:hypothetical protein
MITVSGGYKPGQSGIVDNPGASAIPGDLSDDAGIKARITKITYNVADRIDELCKTKDFEGLGEIRDEIFSINSAIKDRSENQYENSLKNGGSLSSIFSKDFESFKSEGDEVLKAVGMAMKIVLLKAMASSQVGNGHVGENGDEFSDLQRSIQHLDRNFLAKKLDEISSKPAAE